MDKLEQMLGSYGPNPTAYTKDFDPEESPSGVVARTGSFNVRSRVVDDDGGVYAGTSPRIPASTPEFADVQHGQTGNGLSSSRKSGERLASFFLLVFASFSGILLHTTTPYCLACTSLYVLRVVSGCYPFLFFFDPDASS